jgi:hypothetical protein
VPTAANFAAVDAVLGRGRAPDDFTAHKLVLVHKARPGEGAAPVAAALGLEEVDFYWALPRARYDDVCRSRKPFPVALPEHNGRDCVALPRVRQFALCVPLARPARGSPPPRP